MDSSFYYSEFNRAKEFYASRDNQIQAEKRLIDGEYKCFEINGQPPVKPDLPKRTVELISSYITSGHPVIDITPDQTVDHKEVADKLREIYKLVEKNTDDYINGHPNTLLANSITAHGGGAMKLVYTDSYEVPFVFKFVHPECIFPHPSGKHVYEAYETTVGEVKEMVKYANERNQKMFGTRPWLEDWIEHADYKDEYAKLMYVERWTPGFRYYFITNPNGGQPQELINQQKNRFEFIPYSWRATQIASGRSDTPYGQWVGVLRGKETIYESYARSLTALDFHIRLNTYGEYWVPEGEMSWFEAPQTPGGYREVSREALSENGVRPRPEMNLNADFYPYLERVFNHANDFGVDMILAGVTSSDASGRRYESQLGAAEQKLIPYVRTYQSIKSQCGDMLATVLSNKLYNEGGIELGGGRKLNRSDIYTKTRFSITMQVKDPKFDVERIELGLRLYERQVIPLQMFVEDYLKMEDSANHLAKVLAERTMLENELMRNNMVADALEEQGMDEEAQMIRQALKQSQQGQNAPSQKQTIEGRALPGQSGEMASPRPQRMGGMYEG